MKKILWNIDNVKINVPDIYMEEYPEGGKTFKVGFDSKDIAENTGIVQFTFAVKYNGGVILCSDYAVGSDGTISFDLPVGVHVEISGNEGTATKVSSGGGSGGSAIKVIHMTNIDWDHEDPLTHQYPASIEESAEDIQQGIDQNDILVLSDNSSSDSVYYSYIDSIYYYDDYTELTFRNIPQVISTTVEQFNVKILVDRSPARVQAYASSTAFSA